MDPSGLSTEQLSTIRGAPLLAESWRKYLEAGGRARASPLSKMVSAIGVNAVANGLRMAAGDAAECSCYILTKAFIVECSCSGSIPNVFSRFASAA